MAATALPRAARYSIIGACVLGALVLLVLFFPWNFLRGPLASYVSARFERNVSIAGNLDVDLGRIILVTIDGVTVANPDWTATQPMVDAKRVVLRFTIPSLLKMVPQGVQLVDTRVDLERDSQGQDNWHFGSGNEAIPRIGNIVVDRGQIRFRDAKARADLSLSVQSDGAGPDGVVGLKFEGEGTISGERLTVAGTSASLAGLQDIDEPYRVAVAVSAGATRIGFDGTIIPSDTENLRGALRLTGPDLSKLYPIVPAPLPWTPAYKLEGELVHTAHLWSLRGMKGTVGDSDLRGDVRVDLSGKRSMMTADLASIRFDYKDLGGFLGLPPGQPGARAQTVAQQQAEHRRALSYRVLPDKPLELAKLRDHDADVRFRGTSVKWGGIPMDNLVANLKLKDGVLTFAPLDFGFADGHVVVNMKIDATRDVAQAQGEFAARNLELKRIFPKLASPEGTAGRFGGRARFKTEGNTVAAMLAAADGDAAVIMRGGEASTLALVLTNLDLARAAELLLRGDETAQIRCAVVALHSQRGIMTPDVFVVDTSAVVITGEGTVDLRDELYDLALRAKSKRPSLLALRGPIVVKGTLKQPVVGPAIGPVVARVGAAVGLGIVAPPLALLPLIDFGGATDQDCRGLMDAAKINTNTASIDAPSRAMPAKKLAARSPAPGM